MHRRLSPSHHGSTRVSYVGLQFTLAVLVALVPDAYSVAALRAMFAGGLPTPPVRVVRNAL